MNPVLPLKSWPRSDIGTDVVSMVTDLDQAHVSTTGATKCNWV